MPVKVEAEVDEAVCSLFRLMIARETAAVPAPTTEAARKARLALLREAGEPGTCRWCGSSECFWLRNRRGVVVLIDVNGVNHTTNCSKRPGQGDPEVEA